MAVLLRHGLGSHSQIDCSVFGAADGCGLDSGVPSLGSVGIKDGDSGFSSWVGMSFCSHIGFSMCPHGSLTVYFFCCQWRSCWGELLQLVLDSACVSVVSLSVVAGSGGPAG